MKNSFNPIISVPDDSLSIPEIGSWAEKKYRLIGAYSDIFTKSMHLKWNNLVYIDLFAGSGYSRLKETNKIVMSSPLISLSLPIPFSKYIFCEHDSEKCDSLRKRVNRDFSDKDVIIIEGDCNDKIDEIIHHIPNFSRNNTVLSFCFIDPYSLNLNFATVKKLENFAIDFLILLALGMDANRNLESYLKPENMKISKFLGQNNWRSKFVKEHVSDHISFVQFLAREYKLNMERIGYQKAEDFHEIRSIDKNLPLYHLAFFSKHSLGNDFWKKAQSYSDNQKTLF